VASKDDREALQRRFGALDSKERRSIVRAVNRGRAVEVRKHAPLAVHIAHRQMRFWKWSWIIGPAVGLLQIGQLGPVAAALNALLATALLGAMSAYFYLRAQRSVEANLALMGGKRPRPAPDEPEPGRRWWQRSETKERGERTARRWWGGRDTRPATTAGGSGSQGHLPGRPRQAGGDAGGSGERQAGPSPAEGRRPESQLPPERRPYQPRGRKRRGR